MSRIFIIGAGGVGSWLTPTLRMLTKSTHEIILVDGDKLEAKNLDRQLFSDQDIGLNKAFALSRKYEGVKPMEKWFSMGVFAHEPDDWLMVCVDNNAARTEALHVADADGCKVIIAANEVHSAEAYYYTRDWRKSHLDPREYYPEITKDDGENPLARRAGCTGEAQAAKPQLVSANFMAASLAQHLFVLWAMEVPKLDVEILPLLPFKLNSNLSRLEFSRVGDLTKKQKGQKDE